jgi:hypothetical protein
MAAVCLLLFAVCEFHASGFEGRRSCRCVHRPVDDASPALTDSGRIVGEIGCYGVPWEDGIADDVLESVALDFDAMRAAGAV